MRIQFEVAGIQDAGDIHKLQVAAFLPLLEKYQDRATNPANESVDRILERLAQSGSTYYFITVDGVRVGALRVVFDKAKKQARISPIFIVPAFQGKGYGQ